LAAQLYLCFGTAKFGHITSITLYPSFCPFSGNYFPKERLKELKKWNKIFFPFNTALSHLDFKRITHFHTMSFQNKDDLAGFKEARAGLGPFRVCFNYL
jgi:hypothetical protein